MDIKDAKNKIQDAAEGLKERAEARSENIEGKILENMGEMDDDARKAEKVEQNKKKPKF
ncbi:MAG: CsbD family protein [Hydrococcus sp. SU_1_0]|nr:CsbD family protein [Hydrococcus sp. SU_1_0]